MYVCTICAYIYVFARLKLTRVEGVGLKHSYLHSETWGVSTCKLSLLTLGVHTQEGYCS